MGGFEKVDGNKKIVETRKRTFNDQLIMKRIYG